ncbi:MAG: alpha/beta hydrolase [Mycoplasmataceae bacterium]|nr:alpha/beta hydrolase [Mycoplasmataceae bacterium]
METFIEKIIEQTFKSKMKSFSYSEKTLLKFINSKQDPWPSKFIMSSLTVKTETIDGYKYFVLHNSQSKLNKKRILFIHGGAFVGEISSIHWLYIKTLIKKTNAIIYVPIYPLTTDKYSNQIDTNRFLINLWKEITKADDEIFSIIGDSAGGNFALVLAQQIKLNHLKKPQNIILISPCIALEKRPEVEKIGDSDPILTRKLLETVLNWQLKNEDSKNPLFSPIYGDCKDIGDIYIFMGSKEIFLYFINIWIEKMKNQQIKYQLDVKKDMFHDYPIFLVGKNSKETNEKIYKIINNKK